MMDTLFLDRDGVINVQLIGDYVKRTDELVLREDFLSSIPLLLNKFKRFIIVTNQQCIAKGLCTQEDVDTVHEYLQALLLPYGLTFDAIYVCPHIAGGGCSCRKPEIGMALQAKRDFPDIDFANSVMIGDSLTDMQFGRRAGIPTVFIGQVTDENREEIAANSDIIIDSILHYANKL